MSNDRDDATISHQEGMDEPFEEQQDEPRYHKNDYTLKGWEAKIDEEEARWRHLGINLNQMNYAGSEIFAMQAKLQALINVVLEGEVTQENMMLNLKMIILTTMEDIREKIEPQIARAKLMQGVEQAQPIAPEIIFPWMKKGGNGGR